MELLQQKCERNSISWKKTPRKMIKGVLDKQNYLEEIVREQKSKYMTII
jgi:hypothetical protein